MKRYGPAIVIAIGLLLIGSQYMPQGCELPPIVNPISKPTLVAIVYESADMSLPDYVHPARDKIEAMGIECRLIDDDVVTGTGEVPSHLKAAIEAARKNGLPSLVVMSGDVVSKAITLPKDAESILKEVQ